MSPHELPSWAASLRWRGLPTDWPQSRPVRFSIAAGMAGGLPERGALTLLERSYACRAARPWCCSCERSRAWNVT